MFTSPAIATVTSAQGTCACGRAIERCLDSPWRHLDGWTMCDPRKPREVARLHPMSLPGAVVA